MPQLELVRAKAQMVKSMEEYYNSIRTNIQFSGRDLKVITLTSAQTGEGKSTTSVNLAISFAKAGFRTLLIDADTRNSVMSGTFKSKERYDGLTSYLSGNAELSDVICDTTVDNLMVIPAGQVPPNPTSLIQNDNFKAMIETVRGLYDYVIIDTPPLGLVIDAAILAHHSDASLLVTKAGADKRRTITKLKEQLEQSGSVFLGVILNKYDIHLDKYGSYGSYGGYGSYGNYGKSDEKSKNGRGKRKK
ncbi:capsular polysaccharide biosynthesis protein CpsD [Streptococcus infantarius subsp. infantarius]|nr:capsular polysaccharide biosynthesis protein CpsD [Streptococcus infantarius subsp. infantarius]